MRLRKRCRGLSPAPSLTCQAQRRGLSRTCGPCGPASGVGTATRSCLRCGDGHVDLPPVWGRLRGEAAGPQCRQEALLAGRPSPAGTTRGWLWCGPGGRVSCAGLEKSCEVKGLAKAWVCQGSLIYRMKTETVKSVELNKL